MKNKEFFLSTLVTIIMMIMFTACVPVATSTPELVSPTDNIVGMANPSAVYCEGLGYETESVERNGGMDADCIFPDDSRCPAWDFLAGRCGQQYTYCVSQGHTIEPSDANIGTCRFDDGSSCGEYAYFTGECSPGISPAVVDDSVSPAAPLVAKYSVTVETSVGTTRWLGEITSQGEITETSFTN